MGLLLVVTLPRATRRPLWLDEAFTLGATRELVATWRRTGGTMALYYLLVAPVAALSSSRFWIRLPSILLAGAAVAVTVAIGRRIGGRFAGLVAGTTLASSWFLARYAMEARSYALALFLVSVSWWALVEAVRTDDPARSRRWWWVFAVAVVLAPLAHGLAVLQFPIQLLALALAPDRRRWLRSAVPVVAVVAVECIGLFVLGAGEVADWILPLSYADLVLFGRALFGRDGVAFLVGPLAAAGTVGVAYRYGRERTAEAWTALVPALWAWGVPVLILLISIVRPYAEHRYILSSLPGVALVVAGLLARLPRRPVAVATWLLVCGLLLTNQGAAVTSGYEDWPAVARRIEAEARPGDRLLTTELLRAPLDQAFVELGGDPVVTPYSPVDPIERPRRIYTDRAEVGQGSLLLDAPDAPVWLVVRGAANVPRTDELLARASVRARFRVVGSWRYEGNLYLVHLEPVSR